jgi:hypothetical protein
MVKAAVRNLLHAMETEPPLSPTLTQYVAFLRSDDSTAAFTAATVSAAGTASTDAVLSSDTLPLPPVTVAATAAALPKVPSATFKRFLETARKLNERTAAAAAAAAAAGTIASTDAITDTPQSTAIDTAAAEHDTVRTELLITGSEHGATTTVACAELSESAVAAATAVQGLTAKERLKQRIASLSSSVTARNAAAAACKSAAAASSSPTAADADSDVDDDYSDRFSECSRGQLHSAAAVQAAAAAVPPTGVMQADASDNVAPAQTDVIAVTVASDDDQFSSTCDFPQTGESPNDDVANTSALGGSSRRVSTAAAPAAVQGDATVYSQDTDDDHIVDQQSDFPPASDAPEPRTEPITEPKLAVDIAAAEATPSRSERWSLPGSPFNAYASAAAAADEQTAITRQDTTAEAPPVTASDDIGATAADATTAAAAVTEQSDTAEQLEEQLDAAVVAVDTAVQSNVGDAAAASEHAAVDADAVVDEELFKQQEEQEEERSHEATVPQELDWVEGYDATHKCFYYYNSRTEESRW